MKFDDISCIAGRFIAENHVLARFIGLFFIISSVMIIINYRKDPKIKAVEQWKEFSEAINPRSVLTAVVAVFIILALLNKFIVKLRSINYDSYIFLAGTMMFGISALWRNENTGLGVGIILVTLVLFMCLLKAEDFIHLEKVPKLAYIITAAVLAVGMAVFVSVTSVYKHLSFCTSTFDMGIFVQMYHSMITDFSLVTTCERAKELSHFAVHCSPIYYLLFPVYYLFPNPKTLLIAQAVMIVSGVIPMYLICRKYKHSDMITLLFCIVYIFSSSLISPCYYDFHENAFLPPLLMWFFYAFERKGSVLMYIMAVLVLMVKEDAAFYVMCFAMYMIFSGRKRKHGIIIAILSAVYFVTVLSLMSKYGEGAMTNRTFGNLMANYDGGFGDIIKTVITNPVYFLSECFKEDKILFIVIMLLPLLFMPFITKKISRLLLVVPFLVMNLASGYAYASNAEFQYVLGPTAFLIYAAFINVCDLDTKMVKRMAALMAAASVLMFVHADTRRLYYIERYKTYKSEYTRKKMYVEAIPEDASLLCTTFLVPHAANRKEIYMIDENNYYEPDTCDFVAIDMNYTEEWRDEKFAQLASEGYTVYVDIEGIIKIYVSPDYDLQLTK